MNDDRSARTGWAHAARIALLAAMGIACRGEAAPAPSAADQIQLQQMVLETSAQGAVLTLALSAPVAPHLFRLHDPERLVIDLPHTRRRTSLPLPPAGSVIASVRSGARDDQGLRLVLELALPLRAQLQPSADANGYRLRVELGAPAAAPLPLAVPALAASAAPRSVRAVHAPQGERNIIVAVDAGHGGDDPGATGQSGTHEKDVTLAIARALAERINHQSGMRAVLTRDGDYFVALRDRMQRARNAHADMFVSIHADAVRDREVSGASVYVLSERGASSEAARTLAEQENAADLKGGISLANQSPGLRSVLLDLSQSASIGESVEAADRVLGSLDSVGAVRKRQVQQAAFVVLKSPDIPSMLIETAYISNPGEERKLGTPVQQQRLADSIFTGIDSYFRQYPPEGSLYARSHDSVKQDGIQIARSTP